MALFSSPAATVKLKKLRKGRVEAPQGGREFKNYDTYRAYLQSIGKTPRPKNNWYGADGYWQQSEREHGWLGWRNAVYYITYHQSQNYLKPFGQILAYYKQLYSFIKQRKHEIRWLNGAYYLVEDLWEAYEDGITCIATLATKKDIIEILKALNLAIANFAVGQFFRLLFGEYKNSPRKLKDAYNFDRDFIKIEQGEVAQPAYTNAASTKMVALKEMSDIYNEESYINFLKGLDPTGIRIPVFKGYYESDLTLSSQRFGQDSRIQVPLAMLYADSSWFLYDLSLNDVNRDGDGNIYYYNQQFRKAMIKGKKDYSPYGTIFTETDESIIYYAYLACNREVMRIFN